MIDLYAGLSGYIESIWDTEDVHLVRLQPILLVSVRNVAVAGQLRDVSG